MKIGPVAKMVGLVVLACASIAAIKFLDTFPASDITLTPTPTPTPEVVSADISLGTVAVQTFFKSSLIRSGSGTIISSDGLIVTLATVAPYGSGSYVYQVATASGAILRAHAVMRDQGLVLLKVTATDLAAVTFEDLSDASGYQAVGAFVSLSHYVPVVLPAQIAYVTDLEAGLSLDQSFARMLSGARLVDTSQRSLGIVQITGQRARLIGSDIINAVTDRYLNLIKK